MSQAELVEDNTPEEAPEEEITSEEVEDQPEAEDDDQGDEESEEAPEPKAKKPQRTAEDYEKELAGKTRALNDERRQRQRDQARIQRIEEAIQRQYEADEKRRREAAKGEEPLPPDVENDPIGALKFMQEKIARYEQQRAQEAQQRAQYDQQAQAIGRLKTHLDQADAEFAQEHPDFPEAAEYYAQIQMQGYMASGMSQDEAYRHLQAHVIDMSNRALQRGLSPQQIAYDMAKRMGFRSQAERNKPNPLAAAKRGQAASKTISGGGRGARGPIGIKELAVIDDDDEFEKQFDRWEAEMRKQR